MHKDKQFCIVETNAKSYINSYTEKMSTSAFEVTWF